MESDLQTGFVDEAYELISHHGVNLLLGVEKEFLLYEDKMGLLSEAKQISANVQVLQTVANALDSISLQYCVGRGEIGLFSSCSACVLLASRSVTAWC